MVEALNI